MATKLTMINRLVKNLPKSEQKAKREELQKVDSATLRKIFNFRNKYDLP